MDEGVMTTAVRQTVQARFNDIVVEPLISKWEVRVDLVHYDEPAGELRADILLPSGDHQLHRQLHVEVIDAVRRFEEDRRFTVAVIAAFLGAGGEAEDPED